MRRTVAIIIQDKLVWTLIAAISCASLLPATGSAVPIVQKIGNAGIFLLFFMNGVRLNRLDIWHGLKNWRLQGGLFVWVFGAMSLAGLIASSVIGDKIMPEIALGIIYLGALPSTVQAATAFNTIAGGNVAASVVAAALLNLTAVVLTPLLVTLLASGTGLHIPTESFVKIITILLLPFLLGQLLQTKLQSIIAPYKGIISWLDRLVIAVAVYVALSGAILNGLWGQLDAMTIGLLLAATAFILLVGFGGAWLLSGLLRLNIAERKTMLFAGGQKSAAVGAPLAALLFPPDQAGFILLPLIAYHLSQFFVSAPLASNLAKRT